MLFVTAVIALCGSRETPDSLLATKRLTILERVQSDCERDEQPPIERELRVRARGRSGRGTFRAPVCRSRPGGSSLRSTKLKGSQDRRSNQSGPSWANRRRSAMIQLASCASSSSSPAALRTCQWLRSSDLRKSFSSIPITAPSASSTSCRPRNSNTDFDLIMNKCCVVVGREPEADVLLDLHLLLLHVEEWTALVG